MEEEEEMLKYGGLTKRQRFLGTAHHGPFVGHFVLQKSRNKLRERVKSLDLPESHGLNVEGIMSLGCSDNNSKSTQQDISLKWYEQGHPPEMNDVFEGDQRKDSPSGTRLVSSFGRRGSATPSTSTTKGHSRKPSYISQTTTWSSYSFTCVLPSPDCSLPLDSSTGDVLDSLSVDSRLAKSSLVHLDCSTSMVIGYYCDDYQPDSDYWNTGLSLERSVSYIAVYDIVKQMYIVVK